MSVFAFIAADLIAIAILVFGLYFPRHRRRDIIVAFLAVNIGVMGVTYAMTSANISLGFGLSIPIYSPFGARFQHIYRAGDASPSHESYRGVVLDLVGLAWAPFGLANTKLDGFEVLVGLAGTNEGRGPSTNQNNGIPAPGVINSGLVEQFDCNRLEHNGNCCQNALLPHLQAAVDRVVTPRVQDEVKVVFGRFNAKTAIEERGRLGVEMEDAIRAGMKGSGLILETLQVEEIDFSKAFEQSIEDRMKAEVEVAKLQQNLEREKVQANIVRTQAQAKADAILAQARARLGRQQKGRGRARQHARSEGAHQLRDAGGDRGSALIVHFCLPQSGVATIVP